MNLRSQIGVWIVILFIEFLYFYALIHEPHVSEEVIFMVSLIAATLVVGGMAVLKSKEV
ncbi:hypothetical protein GK047_12110 [Paenibacillus sp. SYP-B3998]|uniref:Uncharacterized protein n=1 Tax=Paenibacillus sp. SYP-B3998 TaxID=2678564 RepID=A0A6G3ZXI5_9BACL|nr:hypothetical protein [Paenibacillus sp. SYP-B3998]NEW06758.1 hypothetical protein [Paenibacillus sp. SYP-B3998]